MPEWHAEAEQLFRQAADGFRGRFGTTDPRTLTALNGLARIYAESSRSDEPERLLRQGYEGMKAQEARIPADARGRLVRALRALVRLHGARGNEAEAARYRTEMGAEPARHRK
jgi:hypothetical protein